MPLYLYNAVDEDGNAATGTMEGASARQVTAVLAERGLQVSSVAPETESAGFLTLQRPLSGDELRLFNEQLLAVAQSQLPLAPALQAMAHEIGSRSMRRVLEDVANRLERGESLDGALSAHPGSFPPLYRSLVRAGEKAGNLSGVLAQLSTYMERQAETRYRTQEVLAYPLLVLGAALILIYFLMVEVVPVYAEVIGAFGGAMPWITQLCIRISSAFTAHAFVILLAVAALSAGLLMLFKSRYRFPFLQYPMDWLKLHLGPAGRMFRTAAMARFSRTLSLLLSCRVSAVEAMELAGATTENAVFRDAVNGAANRVASGDRISDAVESTEQFDYTFCWLLATAEERGNLEAALAEMADTYERRVEQQTRSVIALLGPFMIAVVSVLIGNFVVALYLPILTLADTFAGV